MSKDLENKSGEPGDKGQGGETVNPSILGCAAGQGDDTVEPSAKVEPATGGPVVLGRLRQNPSQKSAFAKFIKK